MDKNEELQKWLNDDRYVQKQELSKLWGVSVEAVYSFLIKRRISPVRKIYSHSCKRYVFYDRNKCLITRSAFNEAKDGILELQNKHTFVRISELSSLWGISYNGAASFLQRMGITAARRFNMGNKSGSVALYNRAECEAARPFINQPEQKEVEKVEEKQMELLKNKTIECSNLAARFCGDIAIGRFVMVANELDAKIINEVAGDIICPVLSTQTPQETHDVIKNLIDNNATLLTLGDTDGRLMSIAEAADKGSDIRAIIKFGLTMRDESMPEPTEQTPDIIPADTIDLFTMSELETELKNRGVELTAEVRAKINASDMPEMQHIATMLRGNAKTITIRLSVLNEIAGQLVKTDERKNITKKAENVLKYAAQKKSLRKCDVGVLNSLGYLTNNQAFEAIRPFITRSEALEMPCFANSIIKAYLSNNKTYVILWDKEVVQEFIANEKTKLNLIESIRPVVDCIPDKKINTITDSDDENKLDKILSRLNAIERQITCLSSLSSSEDIVNHFKYAIQSRSNVLSALMSRAKIVIHNESCVILLDQKFAVDKVGESKSKEIINNALMDIGCKDFNIYVLFSGKQDVKNNQEK